MTKKSFLVSVALLFMASLSTAQYTHQTDTLTVTSSSWVLINYGMTYMKYVEVIPDSMTASQVLFIVEGTDTSVQKRHRVPRQSKDGLVTFASYGFYTLEDTLRFLANTGTVKAIVMRKSSFGVR